MLTPESISSKFIIIKNKIMSDSKKIELAMANIDKKFGKGTMVNFDEKIDRTVKRLCTGSIGVDLALGGGWPYGRIIEIFGPESSGKTTLAIHALIEAQKEGFSVGFIDAEHAFDRDYAENLGLDLNKKAFQFTQPDTGEQAFEIIEELVKTGEIKVIIIDSVAALIPKAEIEGDYGESKMGLHARLMSQAMRKLNGMVSKNECILIFINQLRDKIGVMFGSPETTTGGNALKFYASIRLDIRRIGQEKDGDEVIASKTRVKVVKNKTFPPFRKADFNIEFGTGIDVNRELLEIAASNDYKVLEKSGSWFAFKGTKIGNGIDTCKAILQDNPELVEEIKKELYKKLSV